MVPALPPSAAKQAGDFLDRQMRHSLTLNKSSRELMSAITANFDRKHPGYKPPDSSVQK
ncbi:MULTISPECIES: hypothetical protein [unclassified Microcoleus]|uniref:hypothetical protein n=1 Tax=unclassified Microcoleus TaxID=2642155 RepID=UPI002FD680D9